jgi:hypothetical protein
VVAWRFALASVVGISHLKTGTSCQDASACRMFRDSDGREVLVAVVSDGAGTATRAADGAQLACDLFLSEAAAVLECGSPDSCTREFFQGYQARFAEQVGARSSAAGLAPRDFACTFLAAVIGPDCAAFGQVGDGAIIVSTGDALRYGWVFWPQAGEYANQTQFLTDLDADQMLEVRITTARVNEVALMSDGLQRLAFDVATKTAHLPFWGPMFGTVRSAKDGHDEELSEALAQYLASARVTARTDDDTTLILASRRITVPTSSSTEASPNGDC